MNFIEFLGFVISFAALIFLFFKRFLEDRQKRLNPEEYARREAIQQENLQRFLRSIQMDPSAEKTQQQEVEEEEEDEEKYLPPPKPKQERKYRPVPTPPSPTTQQGFSSFSHDLKPADQYEVSRQSYRSNPALKVLKGLHSPKDMLIIKEIFGPPLSMRNPQDDR